MNLEEIREYFINRAGVEETFPFGETTLVFKVKGKMFGLIGLETAESMNLKCDPDYAVELREKHDGDIIPGWHMNKKHWNTVSIVNNLSDDLLKELIDHSYDLVVKSLKKADQEDLLQ